MKLSQLTQMNSEELLNRLEYCYENIKFLELIGDWNMSMAWREQFDFALAEYYIKQKVEARKGFHYV